MVQTCHAWLDASSRPAFVHPDAEILEHEPVPFVSYPYEWSFGMLKDAALLHLEILERSLKSDLILKDSSAFNIQFVGPRPVLIDVLSFARYQPGEPWLGYNQFCKMFLYPLMLQAYKGVPFQSWLRSELEGIDSHCFSRLMGLRDWLRPGVLAHVHTQAWLQRRIAASRTSVRNQIKTAGLSKGAILHNVRRLGRLVKRLSPKGLESPWTVYEEQHTYSEQAWREKEEFVCRIVASAHPRLMWDLGCNVGHFSRLAAEHAGYLVALDADASSVEFFYQNLKKDAQPNLLPLVMNLANLSPEQGWAGRERRSLPERGKPDLALCLALVHHIAISANIPLSSFFAWLAGLGSSVVVEFVDKPDPMVSRLLLNKDDTYDDYNRSAFEQTLERFFQIKERKALSGGTRILFFGVSHAS